MVPRTSYPPIHHHPSSSSTISPTTAQTTLSAFLQRTQTKPHLHPDSYLSSSGIKFSAHSGPNGGLAIHHLKRIEAGLRGQNLVQETQEELARFDSAARSAADEEEELPEGDDRNLDSAIQRTHTAGVNKQGKKRKRASAEEIQDWAESSSQADAPLGQEIESFANTPLHVPTTGISEWQDLEEYEQEQEVWEGEVGGEEREGASVVRQGGVVPDVKTAGGKLDVERDKTEAERKAKKAAKKARREAERQAKGLKTGMG